MPSRHKHCGTCSSSTQQQLSHVSKNTEEKVSNFTKGFNFPPTNALVVNIKADNRCYHSNIFSLAREELAFLYVNANKICIFVDHAISTYLLWLTYEST